MGQVVYDELINFFKGNGREFDGLKTLTSNAKRNARPQFKFTFPDGRIWDVDTKYAAYFIDYIETLRRR